MKNPRTNAHVQAGAVGSAHDFALALERHGNGAAILVLAGELDLYRAPEIEAALTEAIGPESDSDGRDPIGLTIDLRSVTFIDSTTLALLLAAGRRQHARRGELLVLVAPQTPMTVFEVTGFDRLLTITRVGDDPTESAA